MAGSKPAFFPRYYWQKKKKKEDEENIVDIS